MGWPHFIKCVLLFFLFLQGRKSSQVCSCVGSFIHSINRYRYRVPCLPSIGLGVGINRWLLCISIFEEYTKQREARMAIYSECSEGWWVLRQRWLLGSDDPEERKMAASPQGLRGPEGRLGDRISWRDN